jgi:hypothetical protein
MKVARATVDQFAEIPASAKDEMVQDLVDGLESVFQDYISFVASCGTKFLFFHSRNLPYHSDDGTFFFCGNQTMELTQLASCTTDVLWSKQRRFKAELPPSADAVQPGLRLLPSLEEGGAAVVPGPGGQPPRRRRLAPRPAPVHQPRHAAALRAPQHAPLRAHPPQRPRHVPLLQHPLRPLPRRRAVVDRHRRRGRRAPADLPRLAPLLVPEPVRGGRRRRAHPPGS